MDKDYVRIFDTTLRDGEQSPGASLTSAEKLEIARALALLGVDVIEAGFPAASPDDLEAVRRVAIEVGNPQQSETADGKKVKVPIICGLARANKKDIDACWEAVQHAAHPRIHTFIATSPIHMKHKLRMEPEEVVDRVREMVAYAKSLCDDVEFSPEDAGRSEPDFLYYVLGEAIKAGAKTLNIPDTVGYTLPHEFGELIKGIIANTPGLKDSDVVVSVHCHNDLGMATANTIAGVLAGARQAEVTINGIGERAGNTSLEEVVMTLYTRQPVFGLKTGIDTTRIMRVSHLVSNYTGIPVQPNKAIVGANAFSHEAGIHQDGILKNQATYEIMKPETVGLTRSNLVLGKHSGRHAFKVRLAELGYDLSEEEVNDLFIKFKELADRKKTIMDADLEALVEERIYTAHAIYSLDSLQVACGTLGMATATVRLTGPDGKKYVHAAIGTGPIDATYKAIDGIVQAQNTLVEFRVQAITEGVDAVGEVSVRLSADEGSMTPRTMPQTEHHRQRTFGGHGVDLDIVVASAKAYLQALNKLLVSTERTQG